MTETQSLQGTWTYRSFHNDSGLVGGDPAKAAALIFGEGVFTLTQTQDGSVSGKLDMGGGYALDIAGHFQAGVTGPALLQMAGTGIDGTPTEGWEYDYQAFPAPMWPGAVEQAATLVGTTIRAKPHNRQPAGVTASIVMVFAL